MHDKNIAKTMLMIMNDYKIIPMKLKWMYTAQNIFICIITRHYSTAS